MFIGHATYNVALDEWNNTLTYIDMQKKLYQFDNHIIKRRKRGEMARQVDKIKSSQVSKQSLVMVID